LSGAIPPVELFGLSIVPSIEDRSCLGERAAP
jgi:hypothetical protein